MILLYQEKRFRVQSEGAVQSCCIGGERTLGRDLFKSKVFQLQMRWEVYITENEKLVSVLQTIYFNSALEG